jgi:6-phosphogluconate dehydrogenase
MPKLDRQGLRIRRLRNLRRRLGPQRGLQHDDRRRRGAVERLRPIFETLAPRRQGLGTRRTVGRRHFVKMVHNGIEYGMMQAYAEGFSIMKAKKPLDLDLPQISKIWQKGSVVRSWLLDLTADALKKNPTLEGLEAYVPTPAKAAGRSSRRSTSMSRRPVITESLIRRLRSREENNFTDRMISIHAQCLWRTRSQED